MRTLVLFVCTLVLVHANETYQGMGSMKCYGDMSITIRIDGEGFLDCQPAWGSPAAPPQVHHWIVDVGSCILSSDHR